MRKKMQLITIVVTVFIIVFMVVLSTPIRQTYEPELLALFPLEYNFREKYASSIIENEKSKQSMVTVWFPVTKEPYTEASEASLREYIGDEFALDFENYSYAISFGYKVVRIQKDEYLLAEKSTVGDYRFGEVTAFLSSDCSGSYAYLYRFQKDWIDIKYYNQFDGNYSIID